VAEALPDYEIEWLGVPERMEGQLVGDRYPLHQIRVSGFDQGLSLKSLKVLVRLTTAIVRVRRLLQQGKFAAAFTTGGYIAGPTILAARSLGIPVILHESNALPGKVTRWLSPWCTEVALGVATAQQYLAKTETIHVGTPVRPAFLATDLSLDLPIPDGVPLVVVAGGSQGAVAVNRLVRQVAPVWLEAGIWLVHLTGENDPDRDTLHHPHYLSLPFYDQIAALLHRANLAISRAGAGTLTELAITQTPSILIPYPYAAEDHQTYNAQAFVEAGAALLYQQADLSPESLKNQVLALLGNGESSPLATMAVKAGELAVRDSGARMADRIRHWVQ
jgi:UDP-N-acetylglucosamine--N-acetylmuramyl-(pentapeptide) pyrophosphoryl-undecaprenol N-acetylglucosamine transferase